MPITEHYRGVLIRNENEAPFDPKMRGDENGVWEIVVSCPNGVWGGVPAENGFIVI